MSNDDQNPFDHDQPTRKSQALPFLLEKSRRPDRPGPGEVQKASTLETETEADDDDDRMLNPDVVDDILDDLFDG